MALKHWQKLSTQTKYKNAWWTYTISRYALPSGKDGEYHYVHTEGSSFVIPVLADATLLLVNQYRFLNDRESLEFPGGGIREGQNPLEVARKELIEETGYAGELQKVGTFNPYNGITDEICHVFIARNLRPSAAEMQDESEEFEIVKLSVEEMEAKIEINEIYDGMTMASWALAKHLLR